MVPGAENTYNIAMDKYFWIQFMFNYIFCLYKTVKILNFEFKMKNRLSQNMSKCVYNYGTLWVCQCAFSDKTQDWYKY